jgi:hypothetical protein
MFRFYQTYQIIAACFAIIVLGSTAAAANPEKRHEKGASAVAAITPAGTSDVVELTDLRPFTHVAYIPFGADLSSIRFEGINAVKVAVNRRQLTNVSDCKQSWSEPGGSMYCQLTADEEYVPAYRVTYSYRGQPMASDEYGNTYFTFRVYFRPDEIGQEQRRALSSGKIGRTAAAETFALTTSRGSIQEVLLDEANSSLCDGNYVDGSWVHMNAKCEDGIAYIDVASASAYIAVNVNPAASRFETAEPGRGTSQK